MFAERSQQYAIGRTRVTRRPASRYSQQCFGDEDGRMDLLGTWRADANGSPGPHLRLQGLLRCLRRGRRHARLLRLLLRR
eukprot:2204170-Pyramimonas_sp.AAC.1